MAQNVLNAYELLITGEWLAALRDRLTSGSSGWEQIKECLGYLSRTLKDRKRVGFIGQEAMTLLTQLNSKYRHVKNAYIDSQENENLMSTLARWEGRLQEISKNWILSYPETHIDAGKLTKGPMAFLSDEEYHVLEPVESQGLKEATSSLLFSNFTSAEFMALRTAESLLKKWYEKKTSKKLGKTTWGQVLEKVSKEFPKEERPKELLLLDYLRERRNEIAHPESISSPEEASTTFLNVISLCKSLHLK